MIFISNFQGWCSITFEAAFISVDKTEIVIPAGLKLTSGQGLVAVPGTAAATLLKLATLNLFKNTSMFQHLLLRVQAPFYTPTSLLPGPKWRPFCIAPRKQGPPFSYDIALDQVTYHDKATPLAETLHQHTSENGQHWMRSLPYQWFAGAVTHPIWRSANQSFKQ